MFEVRHIGISIIHIGIINIYRDKFVSSQTITRYTNVGGRWYDVSKRIIDV